MPLRFPATLGAMMTILTDLLGKLFRSPVVFGAAMAALALVVAWRVGKRDGWRDRLEGWMDRLEGWVERMDETYGAVG